MADVHTPERRSGNMAAIKGKNTKPEMIVRRLLHRLGYRYVLHATRLPGRPDLVFPSRRKVILVHGCFWHMHKCRWGLVVPATRREFWLTKRMGNVARDRANLDALRSHGWEVHIAWECEIIHQDLASLTRRLTAFLEDGDDSSRRTTPTKRSARSSLREIGE